MYIAALSLPGPVYLTCWVLKFIRCSSKISSVVLSDFPRFCRIWGIASYMMVDKCDTKFRQFDLSLSPLLVTMCYLDIHPAHILLAFFWLHPSVLGNLAPNSTCPPLGNWTRRLQSTKWTGVWLSRLPAAPDRRNCFGIDARGLWLFPGQGQFVPTRARHTPAHTFTRLKQTQIGFLQTNIHICQTELRTSTLPNAHLLLK